MSCLCVKQRRHLLTSSLGTADIRPPARPESWAASSTPALPGEAGYTRLTQLSWGWRRAVVSASPGPFPAGQPGCGQPARVQDRQDRRPSSGSTSGELGAGLGNRLLRLLGGGGSRAWPGPPARLLSHRPVARGPDLVCGSSRRVRVRVVADSGCPEGCLADVRHPRVCVLGFCLGIGHATSSWTCWDLASLFA